MERRWLAWAACLGVVVLAGAGLLAPGSQLLGSAGAEVYGHAWVQSWAAEAWPGLARSTDLLGTPTAWPVIDPLVTWLAAGLSLVLGSTLAWNAVVLGGVVLAFWGGWHLASRLGGHPLTGAVALALAPAFLGSAASGLTEDLAVGLLALGLAGIGRGGWRRALLTGLLLGLLAWTGLYLALMGALGALVLGTWHLAEPGTEPRAQRLGRLALAAGVALVLALPAVGLQGERMQGVRHRSGAPDVQRVEPHWRSNPSRGADLASLVAPGRDAVEDEALIRLHPAYLGFVVLLLAGVAGRRGRGWWVVLGLALLLVPGPELRLAGHSLGLSHPVVSLAQRVPGLSLVNHWGRLALLAHVALAALASLGAARLAEQPRFRRLSAWLPLAVALEYALISPAPLPLPGATAAIPALYDQLGDLPEGSVVVVPSAGPGVQHQRALYRQRAHGRRLMVHPNRPGYGRAEVVPLVRWFAALPGEMKDPPPPRVHTSWAILCDLGVGGVVVEEPYVQQVQELLGPPDVTAEGGAAWAVPTAPAAPAGP